MKLTYLAITLVCCRAGLAQENGAATAKQRYEAAIEQAYQTYLEEVEEEIKAAGARGDLDEANRLAAERDTINTSPTEKLTGSLAGAKWDFGGGRTLTFLANGKARSSGSGESVWIATDHETVLQQNYANRNIFVWKFSEDVNSASRIRFEQSGEAESAQRDN